MNASTVKIPPESFYALVVYRLSTDEGMSANTAVWMCQHESSHLHILHATIRSHPKQNQRGASFLKLGEHSISIDLQIEQCMVYYIVLIVFKNLTAMAIHTSIFKIKIRRK